MYMVHLQFRNVRLKRHPDGGLGFSVKGGVEHNLPILVSKVCRNEDDDHLYIGDAILKVRVVTVPFQMELSSQKKNFLVQCLSDIMTITR